VQNNIRMTLNIEKELCACFIVWQKVFDSVNLTKLMQILKRSGMSWRYRRLINISYVGQSLTLNCTKVRQEVWRFEEELDNDAVC